VVVVRVVGVDFKSKGDGGWYSRGCQSGV